MIRFFGGMESLDETWPSMMKELEQNIDKLVDTDNTNAFLKFMKSENRLYEYEHIAVYMIYRYYPEILLDGQAEAKILFAAASICLLFLMDLHSFQKNTAYTQQDRIELVRRFSKEIEYCPENMERFMNRPPAKLGLDIFRQTCYTILRKCGHRTSASISAFQAEEVGSIPIARSTKKAR